MLIKNSKLFAYKFKTKDNLHIHFNTAFFNPNTLSISYIELQDFDDSYLVNAKDIRFSKTKGYFIINKNLAHLNKVNFLPYDLSISDLPLSHLNHLSLKGTDKSLGSVSSFFINPYNIQIKYLTSELKVHNKQYSTFLSTKWIDQIDWKSRTAYLTLDFDTVFSNFLFPVKTNFTDEIALNVESKNDQISLLRSSPPTRSEHIEPF